MVTREEATNDPRENLGKDIELTNGQIVISGNNDFSFKKYENNLYQAIKNRLLTAYGEMQLHLNYGSGVPLVIGDNQNETLLQELNQEVYFTLLQEPRINEINDIEIELDDNRNDQLNVKITITPISSNELLNLVYELFI
jgi:phage baseplate assembly protein W